MTNTFLDPKKGFFDQLGSGCGSDGRAVDSYTYCPQFESGSLTKFYAQHALRLTFEKTEMKRKRGRECGSLKTVVTLTEYFGCLLTHECIE